MPYPIPLVAPRRLRATGFPMGVPFPMATLSRWYDANSEAFANSDPVGTWTDRVSGYNLTQTTAGYKPLFKTNILNGLPMILFDGGDDRLTAATTAVSATDGTLFMVGFHSAALTAAEAEYAIAISNTAATEYLATGLLNVATGIDVLWSYGYDAAAYQWSQFGVVDAITANRYCVACNSWSNGVDARFYMNGGHLLTDSAVAYNMSAINNFTVGAFGYGTTYVQFWNGYIGEILYYTTQLTNNEVGAVNHYLLNKWMPGYLTE
jgi:hypothetical protein